MTPSPNCINLIKEFEGYAKRLPNGDCQAYPDPGSGGDPWTIGFGTTGPDVRKGVVWTRQKAEDRLAAHVAEFSSKVTKLLGNAPTTQSQFDAMVSFAYNLGPGNLASSTLLKKHTAGDHAGAALEFGKWVNANGKQMPGLVRRRQAEAKLYGGAAT